MQETFVRDPRANSLLTPLYKVSDIRGFWDLAWRYSVVFGAVALSDQLNNPFVTAGTIVLMAGMQTGILNLQHDAWHYLCFRSHKLNDFMGAAFTAYPFLVLYFYQQVRHRGHHAYFGTDKDPDKEMMVNEGRATPAQFVVYFGKFLFAGIIADRLDKVAKGKFDVPGLDLITKNMPTKRTEGLYMMLTHAVLFGLFALTGHWWNYFLYWVLPLFSLTNFLGSIRQFIEHAVPDSDDSVDVPPQQRLFDFDATWYEKFWLAPINFHLHALHHNYPKLPHYNLSAAKRLLSNEGIHYTHTDRKGYISVVKDHVRVLKEKQIEFKKKSVAQ